MNHTAHPQNCDEEVWLLEGTKRCALSAIRPKTNTHVSAWMISRRRTCRQGKDWKDTDTTGYGSSMCKSSGVGLCLESLKKTEEASPGGFRQETLEGTATGNSVRKSIYKDGIGPWTPW